MFSVQAQVLSLLKSVQQKHGLTILFISHDMAVVEAFCDRAAVMAKGELVEIGSPSQLFPGSQDGGDKTTFV